MPLYVLTCLDKANSLQLRMSVRPEHLDYVAAATDIVKLAGPLIDENDGGLIGSHIIIDVPDLAAAQAFLDNDPYTRVGLFETAIVRQYRVNIGPLAAR